MSTIAISKAKPSFYQTTVLKALAKMDKGHMQITLPDGETISIGQDHAQLKAQIQVRHADFFKRVVLYGDIGFGEAYTDGLWDASNITDVIKWIILNIENAPDVSGSSVKSLGLNLFKWLNRIYHNNRSNSISGSQKNISEHYDLNNDFFELWLDESMTYSAGIFKDEHTTLAASQDAKYRRLAEQLCLKASDHVLEIGSGWGGNAIFMAKNYGCRVTSVTISREQQKMAQDRIAAAGLSDLVEVVIRDYRNIEGQFDKIVSIEMLEAVGHNYLETYFEKCAEVLKPDGIFAFQVITSPDSRYESLKNGVDWIQKHIFPGSLLPSVAAINKAINHTSDLTMVDLKDLGLDYAKTLKIWFDNFNAKLKEVKDLGFNDRFIRKWNYYLCYCEAAFAMRNINVMQLTYTRPNNTSR